ncbi:MAG: prenyltransferase/squalene oxidase repeat-containing protein [Candidatus Brocadiia bacterium]
MNSGFSLLRFLLYTAIVVVVLVVAGAIFYFTIGKPHHSAPTREPVAITPSGDKVVDAVNRGIEFLKVYQEEDGHFSAGVLDPKPAVTAMVVEAILNSPAHPKIEDNPYLQKAIAAILATQQPDGGFYTPRIGLGNYCTCVTIMALAAAGKEKYASQIKKAAEYLTGIQHNTPEDPKSDGGFGYFVKSRPDLSNTTMAIEALREAGLPPDAPALQAALKFVTRCQNWTESNTLEMVLNDGGFIYRPGDSKAGEATDATGKKGFKSYGLMSYAGLLSLAYTNVGKEDPRVKAVTKWISENYTVQESKNLGDAGLYYYFRMMAKSLKAAELHDITTATGNRIWAVELSDRLISLQNPKGGWVNTNAEWMESDTVLVTAYSVRTLEFCLDMMGLHTK